VSGAHWVISAMSLGIVARAAEIVKLCPFDGVFSEHQYCMRLYGYIFCVYFFKPA
jgi:hypothetical protein